MSESPFNLTLALISEKENTTHTVSYGTLYPSHKKGEGKGSIQFSKIFMLNKYKKLPRIFLNFRKMP